MNLLLEKKPAQPVAGSPRKPGLPATCWLIEQLGYL